MQVVETLKALREARGALVGRVGLVPTMGALHGGHLALVEAARSDNDAVIATIFVNPAQFGAHEDLSKYPRTLARDLELLESQGADLVFTPANEVVYPAGYQTYVTVENLSEGLEGARRQGHFRGVATVVAKLFNMTQPDAAYFGQKDAQQVIVIRRMAADLNFPLTIEVIPTVREADGLAMSSRNVYLSVEERNAASVLYRALQAAGALYAQGERQPQALRAAMQTVLEAEPLARVHYVSAADAQTLHEAETPTEKPLLLSMAVQIGMTTLIDNLLLPLELNTRAGLTQALGYVERAE